jgi:hypothetical protein
MKQYRQPESSGIGRIELGCMVGCGRREPMRAHDLLERAGLGEAPSGFRAAQRIVLAACLLYALGFAAFFPNAVTNDDESIYLRQAQLALKGIASIPMVNALTGETEQHYAGQYPYGTALAMLVPMALGGWRAAYLIPCASLLGGVLLLARWLRQEGRSPLFALLLLSFPPDLVLGRVAMSDVPSLFAVVLGLWLFWRGIAGGFGYWLASGFVAGASILFRESNPIPFAPFFAGAVLRRDRNVWALVAGGLAGLGMRIAANLFFLGAPFHYRSPYVLALGTLLDRVPLYSLALLVFVPGGLVLALLYRGRRWPELCIAVAAFVTAYLIQEYYVDTTSPLKNMVVTPRYMIPIVPVIVFGMAESVPRLWRRWLEGMSRVARDRLRTAAGGVVAVWIAAAMAASFAVHPAFARWSGSRAEIRDAIGSAIDPQAVILTNFMATRKFLPELDMKYLAVDRATIDVDDARALVQRYPETYIVFLDRSDSAHWIRDAEWNAEFIRAIEPPPQLIYDRQFTATDHLRIWRARLENGGPS